MAHTIYVWFSHIGYAVPIAIVGNWVGNFNTNTKYSSVAFKIKPSKFLEKYSWKFPILNLSIFRKKNFCENSKKKHRMEFCLQACRRKPIIFEQNLFYADWQCFNLFLKINLNKIGKSVFQWFSKPNDHISQKTTKHVDF